MANNPTFACTSNSYTFTGQQNQTGICQQIFVQSIDDNGNIVNGSATMNPTDYAVMDQYGNQSIYTAAEFALLFTVTQNF